MPDASTRTPVPAAAGPTRHPGARWRSPIVWLLCATLHLQGLAQTGSTLLQEPPFTASEPAPNVMLMFDDSGSMGGHQLPSPHGPPSGAVGATGPIRGLGPNVANTWAERTWTIDLHRDFALRAPALNPLWYNPAVRYRPWNKDGAPLLPASIGGSTRGVHFGAATARADPASITERDPRSVWNGTAWVPVGTAAGRGLLGTVPSDPMGARPEDGRRVTSSSPAVDFRYHKMPFDFGPVIPGRPAAAHANQDWTRHDDVGSPLDLFSRPVVSIPGEQQCTTVTENVSTPRNGCFASLASCQANQPPVPVTTTTRWTRVNCDGVTERFDENPAPLTCHLARCPAGSQSGWTAAKTTPPALACDFQYTDCAGNLVTTQTDPGTVSCPWRRPGCDGTYGGLGAVTSASRDPGTLTCWQTRTCSAPLPAFGAWTTTPPASTSGTCFVRTNCSGVTEALPNDPGPLSCGFSRQDCAGGSARLFTDDPGPLTCWNRSTCTGQVETFTGTTSPGPLSCGYQRSNCAGVQERFTTLPPSLTCYTRRNCDGTITGPSTTPPNPATLYCPRGDNVPEPLPTVSTTHVATQLVNSPTRYVRSVTPLGTRTASAVALSNSVTRTSLAPTTVTASRMAPLRTSYVNNATPTSTSTCSTGVTSCTVAEQRTSQRCVQGPSQNVPNPQALTPARYYAYRGSGPRTSPDSYFVVQIDRTRPANDTYPVVDAVTGVAPTAATSARTDCAALTHCTWPEEAQNFANWFLYYRNRMFAAQAVMSEAVSGLTSPAQQQIRLGYGRINHTSGALDPWRTVAGTTIGAVPAIDGFPNPGALVRGVRPFVAGSPERRAFFDWLHGQAWGGPTPNREAIDSVGRYFAWADSRGPWGTTPGSTTTSAQLACRRNFAFLTTDGEWTNFPAGQQLLGSTGPLGGPGTPGTALRTDGPTIVGAGINVGTRFTWRPGEQRSFTGIAGAPDTGTLTDVAAYYWNRDLRPDLPNVLSPINLATRPNPAFWQSMSTYIVAYGLTASMDTPANRDAILAGLPVTWPTVDTSPLLATGGNRVDDSFRAAMASRGNFFSATSLPELRSGILSTFEQLSFRPGSAGGIAVTGPVNNSDTLAFFPSYQTGSWTGSLRAYSHADLLTVANGGTAAPAWTATAPAPDRRRVFTSTDWNRAVPFQADRLLPAQRSQLAGATWSAAELVAWVRGDTSLELAPGNAAGKFRRRMGPFADFVNSAPVHVRAPNFGYGAMPGVGTTYDAYVRQRRSGDAGTVFIGGNGGMMHAFAADTGVERFAYVPRGVYRDLAALASPGYVHRYLVDGQITPGDWHDGTQWRSVVVGTTGAGGASIFAIDSTQVTDPSPAQVRWDLTPDIHPDIGHVLGRGVVGRIRTGPGRDDHRWVYITGNGYESRHNRAALLVIGLADGRVDSIPVEAPWTATQGPGRRNGLGPPTVRYDPQRNITAVYAGDKQGNLWRFDFAQRLPSAPSGFDGSAVPLFFAADAQGRRQPITSAPRLVPHPAGGVSIVFGTGKLFEIDDPVSVDPQAVYAIWEQPQQRRTITRTDLRRITVATTPGGVRTFTVTGAGSRSELGWTLELPPGERVVADPSSEPGLLSIVGFRPNAIEDPCTGGGTSNVYRLQLGTGIGTVEARPGMASAITPVLGLASSRRTLANADLGGAIRQGGAVVPVPPGSPPPDASQCTLYGTSIQGRPTVIAGVCPPFAPLRAWRQPLR